jgi:hypothetical protein
MEKIDFKGNFEFIIKNDEDLTKKYSKALQEVQIERNALRAENEKLKQQFAEKQNESVGPKYFLVRNKITGKYLDFETDEYYSGFGELSGATVFDEELYSYLADKYKKDTYKVYVHLFK